MIVDVHVHKVTDDEAHPYPWRWWFTSDTVFGNCTTEGLSRSQDEAVSDARAVLLRWMADQRTARATKIVVEIELDVPEEEM